jgi:hypothetical protein
VTTTSGGTICGYCAIGSARMAMKPARTMTIDRTEAKTGRSMKNLDITAAFPPSSNPWIPSSGRCWLGSLREA